MTKKKLFLLDCSGYLFRAYFAITGMTNAEGKSTNALYGFIKSIQKLFKDFNPDHVVAVFDGRDNKKQRREIYPEYKAHREAIAPDLPHQIAWAQEYCNFAGISTLAIPEVEADDTMGTIARKAEKEGFEVFLCTSDKDMCQLVDDNVSMLNTHKGNEIIGPKEVEGKYGIPPSKFIDFLAITGDTSDNVPGIYGFGPKTAAKLLNDFKDLEDILEHPENVAGKKKQETLVAEADIARLSRKLVTIDINVDIPKDMTFSEVGDPDNEKLAEFYRTMDFMSLLRDVGSNVDVEEVDTGYTLVDDEENLQKLVATIKKAKTICFDTETTALHPLDAELVGIGFCVEQGKAWYIPANGNLGRETVIAAIKPIFENPKLGFYGHNVKYDCHILKNYGIDVKTICFDTILASYLLNAHIRRHSLDALAMHYFTKTKTPIEHLIGKGKKQISMAEVSIHEVCSYCCEDVDYTCRLKHVLEKELEDRNLTHILEDMELPLLKVLATMERHGIYVDVEKLGSMSKSLVAKIQELEKIVFELAGETFTINSPKQLSAILFEKLGIPPQKKTATGYSTNADVLEKLSIEYPIAAKVLEYRALEKLRSTYVDALPNDVNEKTHRVHCTFNQSVTATGRLSCKNPNLQNIPVRKEIGREIREAFRPENSSWQFLAADYSQIELRLLAHLSEDPTLVKAFNNGDDIHAMTASKVFHVPLDAVTKQQRTYAKTINFGILYGQQAFGLAQELGIGMKEAATFIKEYFGRFPKVRDFIEECKEKARETGKATTMLGRERLIPEINSNNKMIKTAAERLAVNTPLQGTAADLIKHAMIKMQQRLEDNNSEAFMILQVHDELVFETPKYEILTLETDVRDVMENVYSLNVPLIVDISLGKNWKEC
ncbi:MAG: DNA polymerase I [Waddliaceae bacterium]|nr:DNA polymerase I [Waddliaceae bacterium]